MQDGRGAGDIGASRHAQKPRMPTCCALTPLCRRRVYAHAQFDQMDTNRDGVIDRKEFMQARGGLPPLVHHSALPPFICHAHIRGSPHITHAPSSHTPLVTHTPSSHTPPHHAPHW